MKRELRQLLQQKCNSLVNEEQLGDSPHRKQRVWQQREAKLLSIRCRAKIESIQDGDRGREAYYRTRWQYFLKHHDHFYIEEKAGIERAILAEDDCLIEVPIEKMAIDEDFTFDAQNGLKRLAFRYDRLKAVQYAETWWDSYNPDYQYFEVDCTNYISQCLHAGGAPMRGMGNRSTGWWYTGSSWSYSWSVAHALNLYLEHSTIGLRAERVSSPEELMLGDIICYDFEGDGRFNHNTIVTGKDGAGMPLVNAHTTDSRMRYWSYEDSTAYTPNIQYRFYHILDDE
ncbi:amidase domain-containing protein [Bacillus testis]|uniref:amidase domain-containing protein n=1 Tax=Bacillus testis TaxID=1622072 RepID=UPI00067F045E|nr:amidase domain-containing protein [Bacillus testis]